jgi:hypothetical protein
MKRPPLQLAGRSAAAGSRPAAAQRRSRAAAGAASAHRRSATAAPVIDSTAKSEAMQPLCMQCIQQQQQLHNLCWSGREEDASMMQRDQRTTPALARRLRRGPPQWCWLPPPPRAAGRAAPLQRPQTAAAAETHRTQFGMCRDPVLVVMWTAACVHSPPQPVMNMSMSSGPRSQSSNCPRTSHPVCACIQAVQQALAHVLPCGSPGTAGWRRAMCALADQSPWPAAARRWGQWQSAIRRHDALLRCSDDKVQVMLYNTAKAARLD